MLISHISTISKWIDNQSWRPSRSGPSPTACTSPRTARRVSSSYPTFSSIFSKKSRVLRALNGRVSKRSYSEAAAVFSATDHHTLSSEALLEVIFPDRAIAAATSSDPPQPWIPPNIVKNLPYRHIRGVVRLFRESNLSSKFCALSMKHWLHRLLRIGHLETAENVLSKFPAFKPEESYFKVHITQLWSALAWRYALYDKLDRGYQSLTTSLTQEHVLHNSALTEMGIRYANSLVNFYTFFLNMQLLGFSFARAGQIERAEHIFDLVQATVEGPSESLCYSLVSAYVQLRRPQNAKSVVEAFSKFHDGQATRLLQLALSGAFATTDSIDPETQKLVKVIAKQHPRRDSQGYDWIRGSRGLRGDYKEAYRVLEGTSKF
jgi:hypothetical protein